jgi:hypothetical protein
MAPFRLVKESCASSLLRGHKLEDGLKSFATPKEFLLRGGVHGPTGPNNLAQGRARVSMEK